MTLTELRDDYRMKLFRLDLATDREALEAARLYIEALEKRVAY